MVGESIISLFHHLHPLHQLSSGPAWIVSITANRYHLMSLCNFVISSDPCLAGLFFLFCNSRAGAGAEGDTGADPVDDGTFSGAGAGSFDGTYDPYDLIL